ncbi:hypothetical protein IE53DRAFT_409986 [Violaceomyces palustris]|uniref:Uncharacterized protein n=1 Tax=Violaceomyces palustris TaxID=1673888 RepID=A0ACD0P0U9_9BASI|nr:hypothetical protein IE53DRAFT_409986 [Violaceomyces palustris]
MRGLHAVSLPSFWLAMTLTLPLLLVPSPIKAMEIPSTPISEGRGLIQACESVSSSSSSSLLPSAEPPNPRPSTDFASFVASIQKLRETDFLPFVNELEQGDRRKGALVSDERRFFLHAIMGYVLEDPDLEWQASTKLFETFVLFLNHCSGDWSGWERALKGLVSDAEIRAFRREVRRRDQAIREADPP